MEITVQVIEHSLWIIDQGGYQYSKTTKVIVIALGCPLWLHGNPIAKSIKCISSMLYINQSQMDWETDFKMANSTLSEDIV